MHRRRVWDPAILLALCSVGAIIAGCEGGQTGDNGTGGDFCKEIGRRALTTSEADAAGYPALQAIAELVAGRGGEGEALWLHAPPTLWLDAAAAFPPDRSLEAHLFVETPSITEVIYECDFGLDSYPRNPTELEVGVDLRLETAEPRGTLTGHGSMLLWKEERPSYGAWAAVGIDGFEHDGFCVLSSQAASEPALSCDYIWASSECLESSARTGQPAVPRTPLSVNELAALANAASPLTLECEDGRTVTADFQLFVPDSYCGENDSGWTPAVLSVAVEGLGMPADSRSARLAINSKAQCRERGDCLGGLCTESVTEEEFDAGANCAAATVMAAPPIDGTGLTVSVTIQIEADEHKLVEVVAAGPLREDGYSPHCRGWSEL